MILTDEAYEELLRTARFGPVRLGADRAAVVSTLGSPEDVGDGLSGTTILAYRAKHLQVTFRDDKLVHFGLYFQMLDHPISVRNLALSAETAQADLCNWMNDAGLGWTERITSSDTQIRFNNGLVAVFEGGTLESLQVS